MNHRPSMRAVAWIAAGGVLLLAESATATTTETAATAATTTGNQTGDARDDLNLGNPEEPTRFSEEVAPSDPLKIGGQFYWRLMGSAKQGTGPKDWGLSAPALVDVYMDARPNDRVRAFVLGRMFYDPTLPLSGSATSWSGGGGAVSAQGSESPGSALGQQTRGPNVLLDQVWLRADILRTVFVTAGKQHVRWGTAHFWAPTDYLHTVPRNPLLPFDSRTGTTMLKLHLPWEALGWNFYAYALPERQVQTSKIVDVSGAARAEIVLGTLEVGLGIFGNRNSKEKFAGDVSFGLWDFEFYGEAALRDIGDVDFVGFRPDVTFIADASDPDKPWLAQTYHPSTTPNVHFDPSQSSAIPAMVDAFYPTLRGSGWRTQVTGGVSYTHKYADKDTFTLGAEYFYNSLGYSDPRKYLGVLLLPHTTPLNNAATFFYLGRHYLGGYLLVPSPYSWDNTTFTLSTLANLTDKSGISRLDYSVVVLTHLRFEAYGAVHWGQSNGEFRFGIDASFLSNSGLLSNEVIRQLAMPALFDFGIGLRVAL